jgi:dTDP-4-dehydrorhamnose 3,5-epimerase
MQYERLEIPDVIKVTPKALSDSRGYFMETFRQSDFCDFVGRQIDFVQENHSLSHHVYTVRGLHFQRPPFAQGKLVRCMRGSIMDVAVDVRVGSPSFGRHVKAVLTARNNIQLWVPEGFLHGFITLEEDTEVQYKCTNYFSPECSGSVYWGDATLAIDWTILRNQAFLSEKDSAAQSFSSFQSPFN